MQWFDNPGRPPRWKPETLVSVEWSNGRISRHPYRIDQLRWTKTGHPFDINRFRKA